MSWAAKRRLIYGGIVAIVFFFIASVVFYNFFYRAPSCSDGYKNGDEKGVDCGGSCTNLCVFDALNPVVLWSKVFNVSGDVYSLVSYVENPNINSKNENAKYQFKVYDENNKLITVKEGAVFIPKGKKFAVFETGLIIKSSKPKSVEMNFISFGPWKKDLTPDPVLNLKYGSLLSTSTVPRITGTVLNDTLQNIPKVELAVFVLDGNENVVAASRSNVDNLNKRSSQDFVFTWPKPFNLGVEACTSPLDVVIALDRSGSMRSEGLFPPEPFTTVTKTAKSFLKNLTPNDQVAVVSFGTQSKIESELSTDKNIGLNAIDNMFLSTTTQEQTNITDGLSDALNQLKSSVGRKESKKAIIILTDGIPTVPVDPNTPDNPTLSAQQVANNIKSSEINLFTIGLGKNVSEGFLKSLSTDDAHYFFAPTKETLSDIYSRIASSLCQKKPNVINVIYHTF